MAWVTITNVKGPKGDKGDPGEGVTSSLRIRPLSDLPSLNVDNWIGVSYVGLYPVLSENIIGRPRGTSGFAFVTIEPLASGGSLVKWVEYLDPRRTFERVISTDSTRRTEWKRTDAATRTVLHQLSNPGNGALTDTELSRHVRLPVKFFVTVDTWELVIKNHNDQTRNNYGDLSFYEVYISKRKREANGEYGPNFETEPVSLGIPVATGAAGSARRYLLSDIHYQLEANVEYVISYSYDTPDGTPNHMGIGGSYLGTNPAGRMSMSVSNPWSQYTPLDVYIKPVISPDTKFHVYPGSSSETGLNTDYPLRDGWAWRHAEAHNAVPAVLGMSGSTLASWNAGGHFMFTKLTASAPADKVVGNPASNDIYSGATLSDVQARFLTFAGLVRANMGQAFEAIDVFPRATETVAVRAVRLAFNAWLRTLPANILRVYDRASSVSGPDGLMLPAFNSGDGSHLNTAGQRRMAASMISGIPKPDVINSYRFAENSGRTMWAWDYINGREQLIYGDTGWRSISLLNGWTGEAMVKREGQNVRLKVRNLNGSAATSTSCVQLPDGFKVLVLDLPFQYGNTTRRAGFNASGQLFLDTTVVQGSYWTELSFGTTDAWPASLPGTASGIIAYQ